MSKKPAFAMPTRGADLDAWVSGTPSAPAPAPAPAAREAVEASPPAAKPARLTIDLPADLHRRFKTAAAANGVVMVDVVREAIEAWIQKHG